MKKKSVASSITVLLCTLVFAVIGVCFSGFVYSKTKIVIEKVGVIASTVEVFEDKELTKKCTALKLSDMELGLKPATGEVDRDTMVPSTITDEGTSEGYYAKVYVKSGTNFSIKVKNIKIDTKKNQTEANEERKNIYISIKDIKNSTKTLEKNEVEIASFESQDKTLELVFMIWLGALSGKELSGAKISFDLEFVSL